MVATSRRNVVLWLTLAVTLALVAWVGRQEPQGEEIRLTRQAPDVARPVSRIPNAAGVPPLALNWSALDGRGTVPDQSTDDLFKTHGWYVPPPPKPVTAPAPPPKPVAPPVPFTYLGKIEDTPQGTLVILSGSNKVYTVAVGEMLDKTWRVDGEDAGSVRFTYLPLGLPQALSKAAKPVGTKSSETIKTENQGTAS